MARNHRFTQQVWQSPAVRVATPAFRQTRLPLPQRATARPTIIAGQKSGTTSLWAYLSEHPQVDRR
jgi:hypothetical protein